MRRLRNILIGLVGLAALLTAGAYLLPRHVIIEREIVIDATPGDIFPHANSLQAFTEWSPWQGRDPDMVQTFSGPDAGVGAIMEWTSEDPAVGDGRQEIIASVADEEVRMALDFGDMGTAESWITLAADGDSTRVVWGLDADMGNAPVGRWMGLMMDGWVGPDYETGLSNLKAQVEGAG